MKNKALKIVNLILALFLALFSIGYVFAWFADGVTTQLNLNGSAGSYFAYGNGSAEQPFGITTPQHLYNLAWLNNTGRFDKTKYYFTVGTRTQNEDGRYTYTPVTIDMGDTVLPPIGTTANPFLGDFNGCGSIISNLKVSTDLDKITNPVSYNNGDVLYSRAVGMFGETASGAEYCANSSGNVVAIGDADSNSNVHDFILQNPQIEVSGNDAYYNTDSGTDRRVAGLAVGYADGNVNNISIYDSSTSSIPNVKLRVNNLGYTTLNSIIGGANRDATSGVDVTDIIGEGTTTGGENISIFLPPNDGKDRVLGYSAIMTSLNGYSQTQARWTTDRDNADITSSNGVNGLGFGNFFLTFQRLQTQGSSDGMQFRNQGISSFDLTFYGVDADSNQWRIIDSTFDASIDNSYGQLVLDKNNNIYSNDLEYSLRYRSPAVTLGSASTLYLDNEDKIIDSVDTNTGTTNINTSTNEAGQTTRLSTYNNIYLNAFWVNITDNNGSIFFAGSRSNGTLTLKTLLTVAAVTDALRLKAVQSLYNSDPTTYTAFADYIDTVNIFNSNGTRNNTLYNLLINTNIETLTEIDSRYFFAKNDYDILEYVNCVTYGTPILEDFTIRERSSGNGQGVYFSLSTEASTLEYVNDNGSTTTINIAGNSNAGPGLYILYAADEDTSNLDINYFKATGVSHGDAGNEGEEDDPSELTKRVENVDFVYAANGAVVPVTSTNPAYERTNAIVTFEGGAAVILAFTRSVSENDHYILSVSFHNEDSDSAYTVTISQISGRSPAYFDSIPDGSIEFELGW